MVKPVLEHFAKLLSPIRLINKSIFKLCIYAEIKHFEAYLLLTLTIGLHLIEMQLGQ